MKLVRQHSCKLHKNPWNFKWLLHFKPFRQPQEVPLAHTATWTEGRMDTWATGILWISTYEIPGIRILSVGGSLHWAATNPFMFSPMQKSDAKEKGRGRWGGREQEKQWKRNIGGQRSLFLQMRESTRGRTRVAYFWGREDWAGQEDCFWIPNQQGTFFDLLLVSSWDFTLQCWDTFLPSFVYLQY